MIWILTDKNQIFSMYIFTLKYTAIKQIFLRLQYHTYATFKYNFWKNLATENTVILVEYATFTEFVFLIK